LPGDRIHLANGTLYRNNVAVNEPYVTHNQPGVTSGDVVVPFDKFFVLGDARDNSRDSRYWGFVDRSDIIGKPKYIYDSLAPDPADVKPADAKSGDANRVEPTHPPVRRWDRVFRPLEARAM
jgi:signal peptidase I